MIVSIQAHEYAAYPEVLSQMFRTRKAVFFDALRWRVEADGDFERDQYDDMQPVYLVWCDSNRKRHYGSMRLMPTTGPTLLYDVFRRTFPDAAELSAPGIWEGTRMCIDETALAQDYPHISPRQAFCLLLIALCEFALANGIHTMISNYEPHVERLYRRAGATVHELGRADGFGRFPVCCGAFEISRQVLSSMRAALRLSEPLYDRTARPLRSILADYAKAA
ncbi:N-acyl-L-homoserine lactone (AHL) synthase [Aquamicrobium sp. NLF2-7]|uniref:acyl-homoserine-lactone synthase n=1 Tax=Aquamicrobium sp. NLF2-7 TaxID=2918753 RepID=UPI001EFB9ECC|nr:acyl-homoserine-lactone synthase [Aquamicrobium sp. NLF2-7]MCG8273888.1 N-acyl-L-homoserine lactone (AHL) synthase [Aquamicrobium sp. NLF2-7]